MSMRVGLGHAWAIAMRDLRAGLGSPLAWVLMAVWCVLINGALILELYRVHGTPGATVPLIMSALRLGQGLLILLVPALTMSAFVHERVARTLPLLLSLPIPTWAIALGKWLAVMGHMCLLIAILGIQALILSFISDVVAVHVLAAALGLLLLGGVAAALGIWTSLLAESALTAFVLAFGLLAAWLLLGLPADPEGSSWARFANAVGLLPRLGPMLAGRVNAGDAVMALAMTSGFIALTAVGITAARGGVRRWPWSTAGLIIVVATLAVAGADRLNLSWDASPDRRFALHPRLAELIQRQPAAIELIALWERELDAPAAPILDGLRAVAAHNARITVRRIDPVTQAGDNAELAKVIGPVHAPAVIVRRGDRAVRIPVDGGTRPVLQREIASALVALAEVQRPVALFTQGHGELRPDGGDGDGIGLLLSTVRTAGFQTGLIDNASAIPPDALLVVPGPTSPLGVADCGRLDAHLRDGGAIMIIADDRAPRDLAQWLAQRGIGLPQLQIPGGMVIRQRTDHDLGAERGLPHHRLVLGGSAIGGHESVRPTAMGGVQLLAPWSTPLLAVSTTGSGRALTAAPLLSAVAGDAWVAARTAALNPPDDLNQQPRFIIAAALEFVPDPGSIRPGIGARLVVIGSRQFASDGTLADGRWANGRLLADVARWLARRHGSVDIPPAEIAAYQVQASDRALWLLSGLLIAVLPCLLLAPALLNWWDRRQGR